MVIDMRINSAVMREAGRQDGRDVYQMQIKEDGSKGIERFGALHEPGRIQDYASLLREGAELENPQESPFVVYAMIGHLEGMKDAAEEAGHEKNAEMLSGYIKALEEGMLEGTLGFETSRQFIIPKNEIIGEGKADYLEIDGKRILYEIDDTMQADCKVATIPGTIISDVYEMDEHRQAVDVMPIRDPELQERVKGALKGIGMEIDRWNFD